MLFVGTRTQNVLVFTQYSESTQNSVEADVPVGAVAPAPVTDAPVEVDVPVEAGE